MRKKYGKWYADWRDETGVRHAKAFPTKKAAQRHTDKMRAQVAAKKSPRPAASQKPSTAGRKPRREAKRRTKESQPTSNS